MDTQPSFPCRPYIWLASYPKSGNTWARLLLANLLNNEPCRQVIRDHNVLNPFIASARNLFDETLQLDSSEMPHEDTVNLRPLLYRTIAANAQELLFTKTHDALTHTQNGGYLFPPDVTSAAVYFVRNPLDVAVSYYYYSGNHTLNTIIANLCRPTHYIGKDSGGQLRQHLGGWSNHYISWTKQSDIPVKVVRYEDMVANTAKTLFEVATFLELPEANHPDRIKRAVEACEFNKLQKEEQASIEAGNGIGSGPFFRSGSVGSWRNELTPEQVQTIIQHHRTIMTELGYLDEQGEITCL